jgi:MoxR-like ATPase
MQIDVQRIKAQVAERADTLHKIRGEVGKVLVGQEQMFSRLMVALLTGGHVLLEGVPGLAKTTAIKTLAQALDAPFRRIQFTPDLLPSDITGTSVYAPVDGSWNFRAGPLFANVVLVDEINRAPSSRRCRAMQEKQVTIGDTTRSTASSSLDGDAEPDRAGGHLPPPRGAGRPLHAEDPRRVPQARRSARSSIAPSTRCTSRSPVATPADHSRARGGRDDHRRQGEGVRARGGQATRDPEFGLKDLKPPHSYGASPRAPRSTSRWRARSPSSRAAATSRRKKRRTSRTTCCATA